MIGRENFSHDIAAECGTYLNQIGVVMNVENRTIGSQARPETSRHPRRKLSPDGSCSDQNRRRLHLVDKNFKRRRVIFDVERAELLSVANINFIDAVMQNFLSPLQNVSSDEDGVNGLIDLVGELFCLADEFIGDGVNLAVNVIDVNRNAAPSRFIDRRARALDELKNSAASLDAQLTQSAGGVDFDLAVDIFHCSERADFYE